MSLRVLAIGRLRIEPPLILAPMAGVTTPAMRILCERFGAGATFTEMVSAAAAFRHVPAALALLAPSSPDRPFAVQIVGSDPHEMGYAAHLAAARGAQWVDVNMGCPARDIVRTGSGAALMRTPELAADIVRSVRQSVPGEVAVTVKIRAGWDESSINAPEFALRMAEAGAQAVTVHGRTRAQVFSGRSDPEVIARVVDALGVPVIANGDVASADDAAQILERTRAAAVMIGRASWGNPWLFAACQARLAGLPDPPPPTMADRIAAMRDYIREFERQPSFGIGKSVTEVQKHLAWFSASLPGGRMFRNAVFRISDLSGLEAAVDELERVCASL